MLDIRYIRDNTDHIKKITVQKQVTADVDRVVRLDDERREIQQAVDALRQRRKEIARQMKGGKPEAALVAEGKQLKTTLNEQEERLRIVEEELQREMRRVPNVPLDDVPVGASEDENIVVKTVGDKPEFAFAPKNHWEIGTARGWIDKERAAKVAGSRFTYLKGDLVRLEWAMMHYATDVLTDQVTLHQIITDNGLNVTDTPFIPVLPPAVARTDVYEKTGRLDSEETTYKLADDDLWLNASAEHTLAPMYMDEILEEAQLPARFVGYTTAFRREAGTYGKDMEGILRLHQFNKLEMESFTVADDSLQEHLFMVAIQEYLMQQLGLPYQVVMKCTADIGKPNARGVDIEVWLPGQGRYRETHTADLITDYQARPMRTRVRRKNGELEYVHTNDATALSQRPLIGILENYQQEDGMIQVPEVLHTYMGGRTVI